MFKLKPETLIRLLNYLGEKPWQEVNDLIVELSNLEKYGQEKKEINKNDKLQKL